ncbi:MAG: leucine-rich repeat domain-containing protein [Hominimerdicola sp.]
MKKLRKILAVFLSLTLAFGSLGLPADLFEGLWEDSVIGAEAAETLTYGDYEYLILSNGTVKLTKYTGSDSIVNIPSKIDGKNVTYLYYTFQDNTNLTSVNVPEGVTHMNGAFRGCTNLTNVNIPDSVTTLEDTFMNCTSLTSINIPNSVTSMYRAFSGCTSLTSVNIPDSVTSMDYTFSDCTSLTSIDIPDGVTNMCYTFSDCTSLTSVNISDSVTYIFGAFSGCTNLTNVSIPNGVTNMTSAFWGCTSLTSVDIPDSVVYMSNAFSGCTSLTNVNIPDSITNIDYWTFSNCTNLKSVTIPDSVTEIHSTAFENCPNLTIRCYKGSYAETYAIENNIPYKIIGVSGRIIDVTLEKTTYAYTGSEIKPKVVAKYDDVTLTEGTDYTVSYKDNKKIGTGAVIVDFKGKYSGRKTLNFKITDGELPDKPVPEYCFYINIVDEDGNSLSGCTATCNGENVTVTGTHLFLEDIEKDSTIIVEKEGYYPEIISTENYFNEDKSILTVTMYKKTSGEAHKLASAILQTDGIYEDVRNTATTMAIKVEDFDDLHTAVTLDCQVLGEEDNVEEYQFYCMVDGEDYLIASRSDGVFNLKKDDFKISKYYWVVVNSKDNQSTRSPLQLTVVKGDEPEAGYVSWGDDFELVLDEDIPLIGGNTFKIPDLGSRFRATVTSDGTVKVGLGFSDDDLEDDPKSEVEKARQAVENLKNGNRTYKSGSGSLFFDGIEGGVSIVGYGEGKFSSTGVSQISLEVYVTVQAGGGLGYDVMVWVIPLHLSVDFSVSAKYGLTIGYNFETNSISSDSVFTLDLSASVEPFIGIGNSWFNGGIYANCTLNMPIVIANHWSSNEGIQRLVLSGDVGLKGQIGPFEDSLSLLNGDWVIYERYASANYSLGSLNAVNTMSLNSYMAKTERDLYNTANYSISENQEASAPTYNVISSDSVTDIVSDCDTGSSPQVVTCGDTTLMVYKDSDEILKYSVYNKNTNKWGSPANVDSNGSYDSGAYLYSDGEKIYVIYEESDMDLTDSTTLDEYTATLEIAAAVFNSSTGKFENYTRLTNNNQIDSRPVITVADGIPTAAWITNTDSNYFGTNSTNSIVYSSYSDNAWSEPAVLSENLNSITDMNIGTVNDNMYVVYVVDSDNDLTTADDRTLYAVDTDKNINYITEGSVDNIQFTAVPEVTENAVTWYENSEIMYSSEIGGESFNLLDDCNYAISSDYVIANNRIFYVSKNENNTQLNMVNYENGWNQPICVSTSNDGYYYEHLSAAGDMVLMINSKPDFANADSENMNVSSSIAAYIPAEKTNIKVNGVTYDYEYAVPDYQVPIYIDATNTGTQNIEGISVEVYKGNTKVYDNEIDYSIRAGRNESIRILLDTDETLYTGDYKVTVKPLSGTDSDLSDNTAEFNFNMSDLEITSSEYNTSDGGTVSVCVQNNSYVPVADSVITVSDSEGNVIKTIEVPNVAAREIKVYEIPASELLESGVNESFVYLTITNDAQEYDTLNNSDVISVRRFSGITIDSCEISLSKTTAPYTGSAIKPRVTIKDGDKTLVSGTDYVIRYENNVNVGTATIVISGKGTYCGTVKKTFEITESTTAISNCTITIPKSSYTYTGSAIKPKVTVKNGSITLTSGTDYVVRYVNNVDVGTASIVIAGRGNYTGSVTKTFEIAEATTDISSCTITIPQSSYTYTGSAIKPKVTIKNGSAVLTSGTDYVIRYANNINVGTGSIVIAGRGSYSGSVTKTFEITQQTTDISNCTITISKSSYTYTGSAIKPKVTVKNGNTTLTSGTDYVVRYADNIRTCPHRVRTYATAYEYEI